MDRKRSIAFAQVRPSRNPSRYRGVAVVFRDGFRGDLKRGPPMPSGSATDELHAREVNLQILSGMCAGLHQPTGATIADKMLFLVAAMAAEMERALIHERTMDGLAAAAAQGRTGGRPPAVDADTLAIARDRHARGESVTTIATHLGVGRSTLYRALASQEKTSAAEPET